MLFAANFDDVGGVAAACAFRVKGVDGAALHGPDGVFDETAFIECICVDHHLDIHRVRHA